MRADRFALVVVVGLASLLASADAGAFCRTPATAENLSVGPDLCPVGAPPVYWKSACVGYHVNEAASSHLSLRDASTIVRQAFLAWTSPGQVCFPSIEVVALAPTTTREVGYDHENIFVFRDDVIPDAAEPTLQLTTGTFDKETGEILDFDVETNMTIPFILQESADAGAADAGEAMAFDLRFVMTHAAGHFLGLGHSWQDPDAVMWASTNPGPIALPFIKADDAAGICAIYPEEGRTTADSSGNSITVAASACDLFLPPSSCGPPAIHHGCSIGLGGQGSSFAGAAFLALACAFLLRLVTKPEPPRSLTGQRIQRASSKR